MNHNHVAVIDIRKTNVKLVLVDTFTMNEIKVVACPNTIFPGPPWPHFDTQGIWDFLVKALAYFHAKNFLCYIHDYTSSLICVAG